MTPSHPPLPLDLDQMASLLAHLPQGMILSSLEGRVLWMNDAAVRALGMTLEQLQGQATAGLDVLTEEQRRSSAARFQALAAGQPTEPIRYRTTWPGGEERVFEAHSWRLTPSPARPDAPDLICSLFREITAEVRADAQLRERERRLQQLSAAATEGLAFHRDAVITDCNAAFAEMLATSVEDVVGSGAGEFLTEEAMARIRVVLEAQVEARYDFQIRRRDGTTFFAEISARPFQVEGEPNLRVVSMRDVSARRAAEAALEDAQARFAALSAAAPVGLARFGADLTLEECNDAWAAQIGARLEEVVGEGWQTLLHPDHADAVLAAMRETVRTGRTHHGVFRLRAPPGRPELRRWIEGHFSAHRGRQGAFISAVTDVTERILAQHQQARALHEKEVLLKEIHHRVKNNLLLVSSLLLLQRVQTPDLRLARVFANLQARIDAMALVHKLVYQSESLSLVGADLYTHALLDGLQSSMQPPDTQIAITQDIAPVRMEVSHAIPYGLLLNELLTNALLHAFPGRERGHIDVCFQPIGARPGWWQLRVADDGVGSSLGPHDGALGLRLVGMLTEQLDGVLAISSRPGEGLTAAIDFPLPAPAR